MDKLIRLDKAVLGVRLISDQIHKASFNDPRKLTVIFNAINGRPKAKISDKKIKVSLASLIAVSSEKLGHKFTAPDIQSLFDAVAVDYGLNALRDPDLHDTPESFAKALKREEKFWQPFVHKIDFNRIATPIVNLITGQE